MGRPLAPILILSLALGAAAHAAPIHRRHHRPHHLVIEMKDNGRGRRGGPALARTDAQPSQPGSVRRRLGATRAVGSLGFNRGQAVDHADELNGPGAARFNHADSTVGAKVSVPF